MSLTQEITKVVQAANNLTQAVMNKMGQIDQRVVQIENTAKDAVFTEMSKTVYLDNVNGKDSNPGTDNKPIRSISAALAMIPPGGTVNIVCKSNLTNLYGYDADLRAYQTAFIHDGKIVAIDLNSHTWYVKTSQSNPWPELHDPDKYIQIDQRISVDPYSRLSISNGNINVDYGSDAHKTLTFMPHPYCRGLSRIPNSFANYYGVDLTCTVPEFSIFSLDSWTGTRGDGLLNECKIHGVGSVRVVGGGGDYLSLDDIQLCIRSVVFDETFTNN